MIKNLTQYLDYGIFAEAAVLMFSAVFLAIVIRTLVGRRDKYRQYAEVPLDDADSQIPDQSLNLEEPA